MFCKNCGNRLDNNAKFCSKCGTQNEIQVVQQVQDINNMLTKKLNF